jgi:hypothetical protein
MKTKLILLFLFIAIVKLPAQQNPCDCKGTNPDVQYRSKAKHETKFDIYPYAKDTITPETIISWEKKYKKKTKQINRKNVNPVRVSGTPEDSLYILKGYIYFVRHEKSSNGDCDFHIEIGPEKKSKKRVVVEVTKDNCKEQGKITDQINSLGYKFGKDFKKGVHCVVIGLAFYDGWHKPKNHGRAKTHGSSWELHPVQKIEILSN